MKKLQKEINNVSELDSEIGPLVKPKRRKQVRQQKRRRSNDDTDSDQEPLIECLSYFDVYDRLLDFPLMLGLLLTQDKTS
jgi:hypothetical protein